MTYQLPPTINGNPRPVIVCLCGSTRFWREFQRQGLAETMAGKIVLSIGAASGTDDDHFGNLPRAEYDAVKTMLDELHKRKIDLCDEVMILNLDGYIGQSTRSELEYAYDHGKTVRFLEPDKAKGKVRPGWAMPAPPPTLCGCGLPLTVPVAYDAGDGWALLWDCQDRCGDSEEFIHEWPFVAEFAKGCDLADIGFTLA